MNPNLSISLRHVKAIGVNQCLRLFQEHGIIDAAAFLLERVNDILYSVHICVGLCQRNSSRLDPNESEALWFQFLDTFQGEKAINTKWKIRGSDRSAQILRKLFSIFIKEIIEEMIGVVRLPTVMMKLLSDNGTKSLVISKLQYWECWEHMILRREYWTLPDL